MAFSYSIEDNKIIIPNHPDFSAKHTIECGQVFRYNTTPFGYEVYSLHHKATIICQKTHTIIECSDVKYFINYFDLDTDYGKIKLQLSSNPILKEAIKFGQGIRILKQNNFEALISFIISANNNIPRIKKIIENLCTNFGTYQNGYYAFPTVEQLSKVSVEYFKQIGCGYRDKYLYETIQKIHQGFDLEIVRQLSPDEAIKHLRKLSGVGPKVADCILLYGYYKTNSFPTDTWIKKVYKDFAPNASDKTSPEEIRNYFVSMFGNNSGYAQQYLFYGKRENQQ